MVREVQLQYMVTAAYKMLVAVSGIHITYSESA